MPVGLLLCEGGPKSPDIRLIGQITGATVEPYGSKYSLGEAIRARRSVPERGVVGGIRDRDLEVCFSTPVAAPREWRVDGNRVWLGWYWERVEVENYLIDPEVMEKALGSAGPPRRDYEALLDEATNAIAAYTAARTALTRSRVRSARLHNRWGRERGGQEHPFPEDLSVAECRRRIAMLVAQYRDDSRITAAQVNKRFKELLPACRVGGERRSYFLTYFSGKDLLWAMEAGLARLGLGTPGDLVARVLNGMEESTEDVWGWLPEWTRLRELVTAVESNAGP